MAEASVPEELVSSLVTGQREAVPVGDRRSIVDAGDGDLGRGIVRGEGRRATGTGGCRVTRCGVGRRGAAGLVQAL